MSIPYLCELLAASLRNRPKCEKMKVVSSSRVALYIVQLTRKIEAIYICACARHGVADVYLELRRTLRHGRKIVRLGPLAN